MPDVDMSSNDLIKISGVAYTKSEARALVAIVNLWLNKNTAQQERALDSALPEGHSGSSLECPHPFCVAERTPPSH